MKRIERLVEMEKLWKSTDRIASWEDIEWNPLKISGRELYIPFSDDVWEKVEYEGYYFHAGGMVNEAPANYWDRLLLQHLNEWYCLPEDWETPIFINKSASAICIPDPNWADSLALLFQHSDSVLIGMEHMKAEKAAQEAVVRHNHRYLPLNREKVLAFLNQCEEGR